MIAVAPTRIARHVRPRTLGFVARWARLHLRRRITLDGWCWIGRGVRVDVAPESTVQIGRGVRIGPHSHFNSRGTGGIRIGPRTVLGHHAELDSRAGICVGADVLASAYLHVVDYIHGFRDATLIREQPLIASAINIADDVWLGRSVTVGRGVNIGTHSIIGAQSAVTRDIPSGVIALGVPAQVTREIANGTP